jgi:hypothetical protein
MSSPQTYDSLDGRMLHKEGRTGQYVRLSDYEALERELREAMGVHPSETKFWREGPGVRLGGVDQQEIDR